MDMCAQAWQEERHRQQSRWHNIQPGSMRSACGCDAVCQLSAAGLMYRQRQAGFCFAREARTLEGPGQLQVPLLLAVQQAESLRPHLVPGREQRQRRLVAGVPLLQRGGQLLADAGVQVLHGAADPGQPGVQPGVQGHCLSAGLPRGHSPTQLQGTAATLGAQVQATPRWSQRRAAVGHCRGSSRRGPTAWHTDDWKGAVCLVCTPHASSWQQQ